MEKLIDYTKNINTYHKEIKNIILNNSNNIDKKTFNLTFIDIFKFFKNTNKNNNIKFSIDILQYYLKNLTIENLNILNIELINKSKKYIDDKQIYTLFRSLIIKCKKARTTILSKINDSTNKMTNNELDKKINYIIDFIGKTDDLNKMVYYIKKLSIYLDRKQTDNTSILSYNDIIDNIHNILNKNHSIESLLILINKCKKLGNITNNDLEKLLYKCDNNIYDYIYFLNNNQNDNENDNKNKNENKNDNNNNKNNNNDNQEEENKLLKDKTIEFITKLGYNKKECEFIDSLSLKRGFIFGLTKDDKDYILKYQPNKSVMELILNCYIKEINNKSYFLIPNTFFINNDNSYFYIIEKYNTDLYKYFNLLDEKKQILSFKNILNIIYFIIKSVYELHNNNIIHSDLKLENIVLNVDSNNDFKDLKIIDFDVGLFNIIPDKLLNLSDKYNKILNNKKPRGTRIYMLKSTEMSFKNDIFSIGVIALVLLYKNTKLLLSYRKSIDSKTVIKKINEYRTKIEENNAKIELINIIEKYLKKEYKKESKYNKSTNKSTGKNNNSNNNYCKNNIIKINEEINEDKQNINDNVISKNKFIDIDIEATQFRVNNNEKYNEQTYFYRDNDIDKFKILKEFIDDCINTKLDINGLINKYDKLLFC